MTRLAGLLLALALAAPAAAPGYRTQGLRWRSSTITYLNTVPRYAWSLRTAADAWNRSGAAIRFVPVSAESKADFVVSVGHWGPEQGIAKTVSHGHTILRARVELDSTLDRYRAAIVAAHELGHVLGLGHEDRACTVMNSRLAGDHPFRCAPPPAGEWWCELLTADDVAAAVSIYGGRVSPRPAAQYCRR